MTQKICIITLAVWSMVLMTVVTLFLLPSSAFAEDGQWVYDSSVQTLTNETQGVTLNNVQDDGNGQLTIGDNEYLPVKSMDLTGTIVDVSNPDKTYSVADISRLAFNSAEFETVILPDSIKSIGGYAFFGCESLQSIVLPDGLTTIEYSTFDRCSSLAKITIPDGVEEIQSQAFWECESLVSIKLPESLIHIGQSAFAGCSSLDSIDIPDSVTTIESYAFEECTALRCASLSNSLTKIDSSTFRQCTSLLFVDLPESLTEIASSAFSDCKSLETIDIPFGVTTIGSYAFHDCSILNAVTLPESVERINAYAFGRCSSLIGVTMLGDNPPIIDATAFEGCDSIRMICVPASALSEYQAAEGWSSYGDKLEAVYNLTVVNGVDSGWYPSGQTIPLVAHVPEGQHFTGWVVDPADSVSIIDSSSIIAGIIMPEFDVTVTATFAPHTFVDGVCGGCEELEPGYVPVITEGVDAVWQQGSSSGLTFTANTAFSAFDWVEVDGGVLDSSNYAVAEGSTVVTLTSEYLSTLSAGTHTLSIVSDLGSASTSFMIQKASDAGSDNDPDADNDPSNPSSNPSGDSSGNTDNDNLSNDVNEPDDNSKNSEADDDNLPQTSDATIWWPIAGLVLVAVIVGVIAFFKMRNR